MEHSADPTFSVVAAASDTTFDPSSHVIECSAVEEPYWAPVKFGGSCRTANTPATEEVSDNDSGDDEMTPRERPADNSSGQDRLNDLSKLVGTIICMSQCPNAIFQMAKVGTSDGETSDFLEEDSDLSVTDSEGSEFDSDSESESDSDDEDDESAFEEEEDEDEEAVPLSTPLTKRMKSVEDITSPSKRECTPVTNTSYQCTSFYASRVITSRSSLDNCKEYTKGRSCPELPKSTFLQNKAALDASLFGSRGKMEKVRSSSKLSRQNNRTSMPNLKMMSFDNSLDNFQRLRVASSTPRGSGNNNGPNRVSSMAGLKPRYVPNEEKKNADFGHFDSAPFVTNGGHRRRSLVNPFNVLTGTTISARHSASKNRFELSRPPRGERIGFQ